ncbi:MAG: ribonucleotide reductase N-terminal alpha domain-containing protein, partial [Gemmatimonadota bacterium]
MQPPDMAMKTEAIPASIDPTTAPADLPEPRLTENAVTVLGKRYLKKNDDLELIESSKDMFWRVATVIAGMDA